VLEVLEPPMILQLFRYAKIGQVHFFRNSMFSDSRQNVWHLLLIFLVKRSL